MIIEWSGENFEWHWGFVDWKNKTILDIGADFGSTAKCFLAVGATKVIASEGNDQYYEKLVQYAKDKSNIIPDKRWIGSASDFIYLFNTFKVDIVKMDCEGGERYLLDVPDNIIASIKEYAIECHSQDITNKMIQKLKDLKYNILRVEPLAEGYNVIHAMRTQ